jgi:outer membrane lipoprotein carrier protein
MTFISTFIAIAMAVNSADVGIETLQKELAKNKTMSATFRQTQTLKEFKEPIVSHGRLSYRAPSQLRWETETPYKVIMVIDGAVMTTFYPELNHKETKNLTTDRMAGFMVHQIIQFIKGDFEKLAERFEVRINEPKPGRHDVNLKPKGSMAAGPLTAITLRFAGYILEETIIEGKDGGGTVIEFSNVTPNPTLDDAIFSIPK